MGIGSTELLLILMLALILFGAKRIPSLARAVGQGLSEFRRAAREIQGEFNREIYREEEASRTRSPGSASPSALPDGATSDQPTPPRETPGEADHTPSAQEPSDTVGEEPPSEGLPRLPEQEPPPEGTRE